MSGVISRITALAGGATLLLANAQGVFAQYDNYDYYESGVVDGSAAAGVTAFSWIIWCCCSLLGLAMFAFNIWMLVHAIQNAADDQKVLWILLILFVPFGSVIYFFAKKKEFEGGASAKSEPASPPANEGK